MQTEDRSSRVAKTARNAALLLMIGIALLLIGWFLLRDGLDLADKRASVASFFVALTALSFPGLIALYSKVGRSRTTDSEPEAADGDATVLHWFAREVHQDGKKEANRRGIGWSAPLDVRWALRTDAYWSPTANTSAAAMNSDAGETSIDLDGLTSRLVSPSPRQVVVIGHPGAGKSDMAVRLLLAILQRREEDASIAIPFLLPLADWQPREAAFDDWIAAEVSRQYVHRDGLKAMSPSMVKRLRQAQSIFPILDGFDELPRGLQSKAIKAINESFGDGERVVLTCRTREYEHARWVNKPLLHSADLVELMPVNGDAVVAFLDRRLAESESIRWQPLLRALRQDPMCPASRALSTPLMIRLAESVYAPERSRPSELVDKRRFPDRRAVEHQLMAGLLEVASANDGNEPRYSHKDTLRWLTFIATTLNHTGSRNVAWWQLYKAVPLFGRVLSAAVLLAAGSFITTFIGASVAMFASGDELGYDWFHLVVRWAPQFAVGGALAGASVGLVAAFKPPPSLPDEPGTWWPPATLRAWKDRGPWPVFISGTLGGFVLGIAAYGVYGEAATVGAGIFLGIIFGTFAKLAYQLDRWWTVPADLTTSHNPKTTQRNDVTANGRRILLIGIGAFFAVVAAGIVFKLLMRDVESAAEWTIFLGGYVIVVAGFASWTHWVLDSASGWFLLSRIWLVANRRLPFRLLPFLEHANKTGVMRKAGPFFQFRHARLHDWLVGRPFPVEPALWELNGWFRRVEDVPLEDQHAPLVNVGVDHWLDGRKHEAEVCWRQSNRHPSAMYNLAMLLTSAGSIDEAEQLWWQVARTGDPEAVRWLAVLAEREGSLREAKQLCSRAVDLGSRTARYEKCLDLFRQSSIDEAQREWRDLSRRRGSLIGTTIGSASSPLNRGNSLTGSGQRLRATMKSSSFRATVEHAPSAVHESAESLKSLENGVLLYDDGQPKAAEDWWQKAVMEGERRACVFLSLLADYQGRTGEAAYWRDRAQAWSTRSARLGRLIRRSLQRRLGKPWRSGRLWRDFLPDLAGQAGRREPGDRYGRGSR